MEPLTADDPRQIGEFSLRSRLGAGGMGRVYLAFSPGGRAVAMKVVHPGLAADPQFLRRFRNEVAAARAVSGMYAAPVVGAGIDDDPPWLATAYVPGPSLAEVATRYGPLSETAVWRLGAGLTEALRAVHVCGLVHRDLKPGNVLLAADGPHVIDFGISRAFEGTSVTSAGMVVGTPGYMSPEQAEGQQAGPPSDVFSLGCVLAYAATGSAPFGGGSADSILYRVVTGEPDLNGVPASLRQVITACLAKDPGERIGLDQLVPMIATLGPAMSATLGAYWPEPLASMIASDHTRPATQVSVPAGLGAANPADPAGQQPGTWQQPSGAAASTAPTSQYAAPSWPQQAAHSPSPATSWPRQEPASGGSWPGSGQPSGPGGPDGPGGPGGPSAGTPLAQYAPGSGPRCRPAKAQIPAPVLGSIRLMYIGAVVTMADLITGAVVAAGDNAYWVKHQHALRLALRVAAQHNQTMAGALDATTVFGGAVGIVCWLVIARACRRGRSWSRIAGTVLLALNTASLLTVLLATHNDPGVKTVSLLVWIIGVAATIPLWGRQAGNFFQAWSRR